MKDASPVTSETNVYAFICKQIQLQRKTNAKQRPAACMDRYMPVSRF